jgi:hypothetical protein
MSKSLIRAADYRDKARNAAVLAGASVLAHVREKHERAAAVWSGLADLEERVPVRPATS